MSVQSRKLERMFDSDSTIMLETLKRILGDGKPASRSVAEVDRAFRAAHSIKSEAGFLGISAVAESAHRLEDTLSRVREADGQTDETTAAALRRGIHHLARSLVEYRASRDTEVRGSDRSSGPQDVDGGGPRAAAGATRATAGTAAERGMLHEARQRGERLLRVVVQLETVPQMRYARGFLVVNNLEISCAVVRTDPSLDELTAAANGRLTLTVTTAGDEDTVRKAVHVDEVELVEIAELSYAEVLEDTEAPPGAAAGAAGTFPERFGEPLSVSLDSHEEMLLLADELVAAADEAPRGDVSPDAGRLSAAAGSTPARRVCGYARMLKDRLGTIARVQLLDLLREVKTSSVRYAAEQGKRVRVAVGGSGALVSPAVGDALLEAVMHLIRNSIEHGIKTIEERAGAGRHPAAAIRIRVDRLGSRVRMIVQDNGSGVDEAMVRERSNDRVSPLLDILARPGFSMRATADTGSGRGVGLDSVVDTVRNLLHGDIRLINRAGGGSTVVIAVPAATRLVRVLVVESGSAAYAIPRATVVGQHRIERRRIKRDSLGTLYSDYDGRMLPLTTMSGRAPRLDQLGDGLLVLVVRAGRGRRMLLIESILGEEAVVRESGGVERVHSRVTGGDVTFVFPSTLTIKSDSA